jgi:large conductance mechanosensitive channel
MLKEFKAFVMKGNVLDLAVAVIMGGAFGAVVTSLVNDVIMPPIGLLLGKVDFSKLALNLSPDVAIKYGVFLNTIINLLIVGFAVFMLVRSANKMAKPAEAPPAPETKECPFCCSAIPVKATRCGFCTSEQK